jgi:protoheme ferro-lyase
LVILLLPTAAIDIKAQQFARDRGIDMRRTGSLNTSQKFIDALADIVKRRLT